MTGRTADRILKVGDQPVSLASVRQLDRAADGTATVSAGQLALTGAVKGLEDLTVAVGGMSLKPDWAKVQRIVVTAADPPVRSVRYIAKVKLKEASVAQASGAIAFSGAVSGAAGAALAPAESSLLSPELSTLLSAGLAASRQTPTQEHGGGFSMQTPYMDLPLDGGVLVGFNYTLGSFLNHDIIDSLQPIYLTAHGEVVGQMQGTANSETHQIRAKDGYVVTGIHIRAGGNFDGFGLIFTRLEGTTLDRKDTYESDWVGIREGGSEALLDTDGGLVVGITGKKANKIGSLAFFVLPLNNDNR